MNFIFQVTVFTHTNLAQYHYSLSVLRALLNYERSILPQYRTITTHTQPQH
jgi:hypothetical protein